MFRKLLRLPRYYLLRIKRLKGDPEYLARGLAFGVFMGVLPLAPVQTIILVPLTVLLRVSTLAAFIASVLVSNPLTFMPQYYLTWKVGNAVLPDRISWERLNEILTEVTAILEREELLNGIVLSLKTLSRLGMETLSVLLVGGVIIAVPASIVAYCFGRRFFRAVHERRLRRQRLDSRN